MRNVIIELINNALSLRTAYFLREEDIQLYLANHFIGSRLFNNVFIEYHLPSLMIPGYQWTDANNIYVDIVLEHNGNYYPIEIKYKTTTQELPFFIFGNPVNVLLGHHGASNIGCYDFWKDIKRIELFEASFPNVDRGIVLFVSNDPTYRQPPLNPGVGYAPFSIHEGRTVAPNSVLDWNGVQKVAIGRPSITLLYNYLIHWTPLPITQHFYILT